MSPGTRWGAYNAPSDPLAAACCLFGVDIFTLIYETADEADAYMFYRCFFLFFFCFFRLETAVLGNG